MLTTLHRPLTIAEYLNDQYHFDADVDLTTPKPKKLSKRDEALERWKKDLELLYVKVFPKHFFKFSYFTPFEYYLFDHTEVRANRLIVCNKDLQTYFDKLPLKDLPSDRRTYIKNRIRRIANLPFTFDKNFSKTLIRSKANQVVNYLAECFRANEQIYFIRIGNNVYVQDQIDLLDRKIAYLNELANNHTLPRRAFFSEIGNEKKLYHYHMIAPSEKLKDFIFDYCEKYGISYHDEPPLVTNTRFSAHTLANYCRKSDTFYRFSG